MRLLAVLAVTLFLSAVVTFAIVGLEAQERARTEHAEMLRRLEVTREARTTIPAVSYAENEALTAERERLAEIGNQRLAMLTDRRYALPPQSLEDTLEGVALTNLQPGTPLRISIETWAEEDQHTEAALARLIALIHLSGIQEVESLDRRAQDTLAIPDLHAEGFELVVVSEMEDVLDLLEQLVPGRGEPALSVTGASLRRIEQGLWSTTPDGLDTPPVRLWLRIEAHHLSHPGSAAAHGRPAEEG